MRPYLRVANVFEDRIDISDVMEMNFSPEEYETYSLGFGDILLNEGQSMEFVGRPAMYRDEIPGACFTNTLVRFRAKEGVDARYALMVFMAYLKNGRFQKIATITVNIAHLGAGRFAEIEFPLPPTEEQAAITEQVDAHLSVIEAAEKTISENLLRAAQLRQSILKQAFEGRLVPQDPADEPASALLARIRASREAEPRILPATKPARERPAASAGRRRQPAGNIFRRGAVACYIIRALADRSSFGRTQLEKVLHLTQAHLGVDLALVFERYPAGPFDKSIYQLEGFARKQGWFGTEDRPSVGVHYRPGPNIVERCEAAVAILGDKRAGLDELLAHVAGMDTDGAEVVSTVYAAWNDLLIDGRPATPGAIIAEVYAWDESKKRFPDSRITRCIDWMKGNGYTPTGAGQRTTQRPPVSEKKGRRGRRKS